MCKLDFPACVHYNVMCIKYLLYLALLTSHSPYECHCISIFLVQTVFARVKKGRYF